MMLSVYFTFKKLKVSFIRYSIYTILFFLEKQYKCVGNNYLNNGDILWDVIK